LSFARKILFALLLSIFLLPGTSRGIVYIEVDSPQLRLYNLAFPAVRPLGPPNPKVAKELEEILERDLTIAHLFYLLPRESFPQGGTFVTPWGIDYPAWKETGAEFLLSVGYEARGGFLSLRFHLFDCVQGRPIGAKRYRGRLANLRPMVHRLMDDMLQMLTGQRGFFSSKIAFISDSSGLKEIYMVDPDGGKWQPLVKNGSINISPSWSPDGKRLLFTCFTRRNPDLYEFHLPTGRVRLLSGRPGPNAAASYSPDGRRIALMMRGREGTDIFLMPAKGGPPKRITHSPASETSPTWSPDGRKIAFVSDRTGSPQIYVKDLRTGKSSRITFVGSYNCSPAWSPKGNWIAYSGRWEGRFRIFLVRPDGSDLRLITQGPGNHEDPSWAPDGRHIVFSSNARGGYDLYVTTTEGGGPWRITSGKGNETEPAWSPLLGR